MNKKIRYFIKNIIIVIFIVVVSTVFSISSYFTKSDYLISTSFLVNYLGVFLGISITLVTYIHTTLLGVNEKGNYKKYIFRELKHNTLFIFTLFICSILIMGIEKIDFPFVLLGELVKYKYLVIDFIRNLFLFLSLYGMYDTISSLFILIFDDKE